MNAEKGLALAAVVIATVIFIGIILVIVLSLRGPSTGTVCTSTSNCPIGQVCDGPTKTCRVQNGQVCTENSNCLTSSQCVAGVCVGITLVPSDIVIPTTLYIPQKTIVTPTLLPLPRIDTDIEASVDVSLDSEIISIDETIDDETVDDETSSDESSSSSDEVIETEPITSNIDYIRVIPMFNIYSDPDTDI